MPAEWQPAEPTEPQPAVPTEPPPAVPVEARPQQPDARNGSITVDGERLAIRPGQTIAAVLLVAGRGVFRLTRFGGRPRGLFCGMGVCHDCLVTVNDRSGVRACLRPAVDGDVVRTDLPA